jgi:hypothetical protein
MARLSEMWPDENGSAMGMGKIASYDNRSSRLGWPRFVLIMREREYSHD